MITQHDPDPAAIPLVAYWWRVKHQVDGLMIPPFYDALNNPPPPPLASPACISSFHFHFLLQTDHHPTVALWLYLPFMEFLLVLYFFFTLDIQCEQWSDSFNFRQRPMKDSAAY